MKRCPLTPLLLLPASLLAQQPMHLTLADAQRIAIQNNPQYSSAKYIAAAVHQQPAQYRAAELPSWRRPHRRRRRQRLPPRRRRAQQSDRLQPCRRRHRRQPVDHRFRPYHNLVGMSNLQAQAQDQASEITRADVLLAATRAYFDVLRAKPYSKSLNRPWSRASWSPIKSPLWRRASCARARRQLRQRQSLGREAPSTAGGKRHQLRQSRARRRTGITQPDHVRCSRRTHARRAARASRSTDRASHAEPSRPERSATPPIRRRTFHPRRARSLLPHSQRLAAAGGVPAGESQVPDHYAAAGINVNIPIFNGGLFKARESEASLKAKAAAQNVADLANRITRDVRVAWLNATTALQRVTLTNNGGQAQQALDLAQSRID